MTASPSPLNILNEADYQKYRVPTDLGSFGSLSTSLGILPLQSMQLRGDITGLLCHLKLVQRFFNPYDQPLEATYIFPLPARAAVSSFVMQTQSRRVVGRLQERGEARRQYQEAVAQGKQAALAEEERAEVFTMTVGNIPPGEFVEVELELDGPLTWSDGQAMFRFPLVVAPRYIPGKPYEGESVGQGVHLDTDAVPDASRISPPVLLSGYPNPVQLSVEVHAHCGGLSLGLPCVSLPDLLCWQDGSTYKLVLRPTADRLDRDLIVRFPLPSPKIQSSLQVESRDPNTHFFALNLVPDDLHQQGPQVPRQVVTLLDRSGSMEGWKMVCARRAVGRLIDSLCDHDSFQVLNFDTTVEPLDPNRPGLRFAVDRERYLALEKLAKVEARGGTEILAALQLGVKFLKGHSDPFLILITDGQVGNESEVLRWVQQNASGIRIFTIGIDKAVNLSLLERLAQVSGGHFTLVESEEQLDETMVTLRRRINPPLLQQVSVQLAGASVAPEYVDLYEGLCSRQMGKIEGPLPHQIEVLGYSRDGQAFRNQLAVHRVSGASIEKIWARERVLELEHGFLAGWKQEQYRPESIARFALAHGVLCRFTAFVAIDEESFVPGTLHKVTQAVSEPDGWEEENKSQPRAALMRRSASAGRPASHGLRSKDASGSPPPGKPTLGRPQARLGFIPPAAPSSPPPMADAFGGGGDLFGSTDPFACAADPFACAADPFAAPDPFAAAPAADPFAAPAADPFAASAADPFAAAPAADPFAAPAADPFAAAPDPFAAAPAADPFSTPSKGGWMPVGSSMDPVQQAVHRFRVATTTGEWEAALQSLIEALIRRGFSLAQVDPLLKFRQQVTAQPGFISQSDRKLWIGQMETWLEALFNPPGSSRQESFWK